jgi:hypothetical protein
MFCPRCSQQQLSSDVRFCSRCGFSLQAVAEILSNDGVLTANQAETEDLTPVVRKGGLRFGAKIVFLSIFLALPAGFALSLIFDSPFPLLIALVPFLIGLAQMLYVFIFGESLIQLPRENQTATLSAKQSNFSLPESQSAILRVINQKPLNTAEIDRPYSVTEQTTNLLKND